MNLFIDSPSPSTRLENNINHLGVWDATPSHSFGKYESDPVQQRNIRSQPSCQWGNPGSRGAVCGFRDPGQDRVMAAGQHNNSGIPPQFTPPLCITGGAVWA